MGIDARIEQVKKHVAARKAICALLAGFPEEEQRMLLAECAIEVEAGLAPVPSKPAAQTQSPPTAPLPSNDSDDEAAGSPTALVRGILDRATAWLRAGEILAKAKEVNPDIDKLNIYSACSKLARRDKIARSGNDPKNMLYASHANAATWKQKSQAIALK